MIYQELDNRFYKDMTNNLSILSFQVLSPPNTDLVFERCKHSRNSTDIGYCVHSLFQNYS